MDSGPACRAKCSSPVFALAAGAWFLAVAAGFLALWIYKMAPGEKGASVAQRWPSESGIPLAQGRFTLALFAHPHCPCTRASIAELAQLLARFHDRLEARVVFAGEAQDGDLRASAERISGVTVLRDPLGIESARFGARTSGSAFLYDPQGNLQFAGGLTPARGHEGDSFGMRRLATILSGNAPDRRDAPVFGCALEADETPARMARADDVDHKGGKR